MKTKQIFTLMFLSIMTVILSSCAPLILKANFDSDRIAVAPNLSPPGSPSGDEIILSAEEGCFFTVENNSTFGSSVLRFTPINSTCGNSLRFVSSNVRHSNDYLSFFFVLSKESLKCHIYLTLKAHTSPLDHDAFQVRLDNDGSIILIDGTLRGREIGTFSPNQKMIFFGAIDWRTNTFNLTIVRSGVANIEIKDRPLKSRDFWHQLKYELHLTQIGCYPPPSNRSYYIDNVRIGTSR